MGPVVRVLTRTVRWRLALIGAGLAASVGVVGCSLFPTDASPPPTDSTVRIDTRWVVGEAAAAVGLSKWFLYRQSKSNPAARRLGGAIRWDVEVLKALMAEQAKNRDD